MDNNPAKLVPRNSFQHPVSSKDSPLISKVRKILDISSRLMMDIPWALERSFEVATINAQILAEYDFDLKSALARQPNSVCQPGSEFKPVSVLKSILQSAAAVT